MPRRSKKAQSDLMLVVVVVIFAIGAGVVALINFLVESKLIWLLPVEF